VIAEAFSHEEILNRGGRIVFGSRLFGLWTHRNEFDKQSIEEIAVKPVPSLRAAYGPFRRMAAPSRASEPPPTRRHLFERSSEGILHFAPISGQRSTHGSGTR
jgi:hypothetical protein